MSLTIVETLIKELIETNCIKMGNWKLKNGEISKYYFDIKNIDPFSLDVRIQDYINSPTDNPDETLRYFLDLGYNKPTKWSSTSTDTIPNHRIKELFGQSHCFKDLPIN